MRYFFLSACFTVLLTACAPRVNPDAEGSSIDRLFTAMTGSYDSSAQASVRDEYYNIDLHMEPIWEDRGRYFYVEQAVADAPERPYRQRVYRLERKGRKIISHVYELPEPKRFVGAHDDPSKLAAISPEDLIEREGCAVILKETEPGTWRGETKKKRCKSSLSGAVYATSRVSVTDSFIQSWDRGFNEEDEQVWGATEGGYMFFKK